MFGHFNKIKFLYFTQIKTIIPNTDLLNNNRKKERADNNQHSEMKCRSYHLIQHTRD